MQYNTGQQSVLNDISTDPMMVTVPPTEKYGNSQTFWTSSHAGNELGTPSVCNNYITIVAAVSDVNFLTLNSDPLG